MSLLFNNRENEYDRSTTMFSPDGRIIQVEYANNAVKNSPTSIGMVCEDGVFVVIDKRHTGNLIVDEFTEKIMQIDEHIGAAISGFMNDGRVLIERSQLKAQHYRVTFDNEIDVKSIVKHICQEKQIFTQFGGLRPYGVNLMVAGVDDKARLFITKPIGSFLECKAAVFGDGEPEIKEKLQKKYKKDTKILEGLNICKELIKSHIGKKFDIRRIDGFYIKTDEKQYKRFTKKQIGK